MSGQPKELTIGDVCDVIRPRNSKELHPVLTFKGLHADGSLHLTEAEQGQFTVANAGDIVFTKQGHIAGWAMKKIGIVAGPKPVHVAGTLQVIRPRSGLNPRYLYYWLSRQETYDYVLRELAGRAGITDSVLKAIPIAVAPTSQQEHIVRLLDEAFEGIAVAKDNAEKNLQNARALFERHLQSVFSQVSDQWRNVPLAEISSIESGAGFPLKYQGLQAEQYPFYKVGDMNSIGNERWLSHANHMISDVTRKKLGAHLFPAGTIVFPKVGGAINTNKKRIATTECCIDNNCFGVSPVVELINAELLYYWFRSIKLAEFANEAALPSITKTTLSSWPVAMPIQRKEQDRIVESLAQLELITGTLSFIAEKKLSLIIQLSRMLLSQAFSGDSKAAA